MPVLPEVESMIALSEVRAPRRSPSSIIDRAARSFTDPPGLNHSAFAYTSTRGNSRSNMRMRSNGVLPIKRVIPAEAVRWLMFIRIESSVSSSLACQAWSIAEVDQDQADHDIHGGKAVADQRSPVHTAPFGGEDVEDRLPDQVAPAKQGDRRRIAQHSVEEDRARHQDLEQLEGGVDGQNQEASACAKSATMSSGSSIPTETLTVPGVTPSSALSSRV